MKNIIVGQSGGPTSVINSSVAGVYKKAKELGYDHVYGMVNGIEGFLNENIIDNSLSTLYSLKPCISYFFCFLTIIFSFGEGSHQFIILVQSTVLSMTVNLPNKVVLLRSNSY